jgi:lysylphosphatidylglycerol synthetase-like protein (DUF2156 family)
VDSYNTRAAALVAVIVAVVSVIATINPGQSRDVRWILGGATLVFVVAGVLSVRSWRVQSYAFGTLLTVETTEQFLLLEHTPLQYQLLANRLHSIECNRKALREKRLDFTVAAGVALVGAALIILVVLIRLHDPTP